MQSSEIYTRDRYTLKGSADEIQRNGSFLQGERRVNSSLTNKAALERVPTGKGKLNVEKIRTLLLKSVIEPGQVPWCLKALIELSNS